HRHLRGERVAGGESHPSERAPRAKERAGQGGSCRPARGGGPPARPPRAARSIELARATLADLTAGGATQLGTASHDDYAPCTDDGQTCTNDIYAVSLPSVLPSAFVTWFQAEEACANAGKRLPTSAERQGGGQRRPSDG